MTDDKDADRKSLSIHNERVKLTATWLNGLAVAVFAVGGLAPIFSALGRDASVSPFVALGSVICIGASPALHSWARRTLKDLR